VSSSYPCLLVSSLCASAVVWGGRSTPALTFLRLKRWLRSNERCVVICIRSRGERLDVDVNEGDMCSVVVKIGMSSTRER
jgi:hypothetical protein